MAPGCRHSLALPALCIHILTRHIATTPSIRGRAVKMLGERCHCTCSRWGACSGIGSQQKHTKYLITRQVLNLESPAEHLHGDVSVRMHCVLAFGDNSGEVADAKSHSAICQATSLKCFWDLMTSLMPQALPDRAYIVVDAQKYRRRTGNCT